VNLGNPNYAIPYFQQALELEPTYEDISSIYSYLGLCLKEMEQYKEALKVLKKGITVDPERTDILNLMGYCHFKLKEHESAIECFKNIVKLNPSSAIDYANIASNYRDMNNTEKAIQYYRIALEIDPSIDFARQNLEKLTGKA
jgi:ribosomal protein S12 methylthiotransferase accessory factor